MQGQQRRRYDSTGRGSLYWPSSNGESAPHHGSKSGKRGLRSCVSAVCFFFFFFLKVFMSITAIARWVRL